MKLIDKILFGIGVFLMGPFLLVGSSAIISEALPFVIGFTVGIAIVLVVWKLTLKALADDEKEEG